MQNTMIFFVLVVIFTFFNGVETIKCIIGHGQRGLKYKNEISWTRNCPQTKYCFEAVTNNIDKVKQLIDYPWDPYYSEYFIRSCGGDYDTQLDYHPYRGKPKSIRKTPGAVKLNITTPKIITGHGGREVMDLGYICRRDLCSGSFSAQSWRNTALCTSTIILISVWFLI